MLDKLYDYFNNAIGDVNKDNNTLKFGLYGNFGDVELFLDFDMTISFGHIQFLCKCFLIQTVYFVHISIKCIKPFEICFAAKLFKIGLVNF